MNAAFLAFAYLRYHRVQSLVLVLVLALILVVPLATRILLAESEASLTARAEATPLLLGRRGSALDLTMAALYFSDDRPDALPMAEAEAVWDSGLATPIPLHTAFETNGFRIIGTSLDYFDFRGLTVEEGRGLAVLGEAVVGATVARKLDLAIGDTLVSAPQNLFDLAGVYPLEMPVVGILAPTNTPDDEAVFVDLKTTWVISGIGHGHEDVVSAADLEAGADVTAAASIVQYQRITPENIDSFHFHGDADDYPVSAVVVVPPDVRSATILRGRYLDPDGTSQLLQPAQVVQGLVDRIFRIRAVLDVVTGIIALAALAALGLAIFLSFRLRAREVETAVKLGARRGMVLQLLAAETLMILCASLVIAIAAALVVRHNANAWVGWLLTLGS
ncbi:MAG: ABC transporter permease [Kiloniellales bacterium]|nr:ABC transporter permease [Kiloniellales bacterium]